MFIEGLLRVHMKMFNITTKCFQLLIITPTIFSTARVKVLLVLRRSFFMGIITTNKKYIYANLQYFLDWATLNNFVRVEVFLLHFLISF